MSKKIYRTTHDKWVLGVLQGIADAYGWDANILRAIFIVVAVATSFFPMAIAYFVAAMIIPTRPTNLR